MLASTGTVGVSGTTGGSGKTGVLFLILVQPLDANMRAASAISAACFPMASLVRREVFCILNAALDS